MLAMRMETNVFGNDEVPTDEFDLLIDIWFCFENRERLVFALGADIQCDFDGLVDLVVGEGLALMGWVTFLCSDVAFASPVFVFAWLNDVGGGGLGGIAGVLFELGDFGFEFGNFFEQLVDESRLFQNHLLQVHKRRVHIFRS